MIYLPEDILNIIKSFFIENINIKKYIIFVNNYKRNIYFSALTKKPCIFQLNYKKKELF
jgi:hypothetical protein